MKLGELAKDIPSSTHVGIQCMISPILRFPLWRPIVLRRQTLKFG